MDSKIKRLQRQLTQASDRKTKDWFERYLKHVIPYRGVKTPVVGKLLSKWRDTESLNELPAMDQLKVATKLIEQNYAEDKFAGIIYIQKYLLNQVPAEILMEEFERLFRKKVFWDWSTTDWFTVRVLDKLILKEGKAVAARIECWSEAADLWQRRCSIVAFRGASKEKKYHPTIKRIIKNLVTEKERFIQTGIGWTIAELSRHHPDAAEKLVERHFKALSTEVIKRHTKYLPKHENYRARARTRP